MVHTNHFYKSVLGALEFDGPAIISCYTTCQPEHGVADNMAGEQARLAVDTRAFPLLIYDPRRPATRFKQRLSLQGNPAMKEDWYTNPKTAEVVDFITSRAAKAVSPSNSIRTAIRRRRFGRTSKTVSRTGICCKSWPDYGDCQRSSTRLQRESLTRPRTRSSEDASAT